jgi:hypothetical protein
LDREGAWKVKLPPDPDEAELEDDEDLLDLAKEQRTTLSQIRLILIGILLLILNGIIVIIWRLGPR